jgi:hypothetical protein
MEFLSVLVVVGAVGASTFLRVKGSAIANSVDKRIGDLIHVPRREVFDREAKTVVEANLTLDR